MKKGDIVVVPFPFTDLSGVKLRPSVVLIESNPDIVVAFITSKTKLSEPTLMIKATEINGLKTDSFLRLNKITTIDRILFTADWVALQRRKSMIWTCNCCKF